MANIHTFGEYSDDVENQRGSVNGPNRRPLENPWQNNNNEMNYDNQNGEAVQGGPMVRAAGEDIPLSSLKPYQYLCLCCCPCCIGNPCSEARKKTYLSVVKTFCFVAAVVMVLKKLTLYSSPFFLLFTLPTLLFTSFILSSFFFFLNLLCWIFL